MAKPGVIVGSSMNKQKFLQKLGITAGKWKDENGIIMTSNYRPDVICQTFDSFDGDYCNAEQNNKLICAAPDMLIALISAAIQFNKYAIGHFAKGKMEKWGTNNYYFVYLKNQIEKATGKPWEDVLTIWNECQEDEVDYVSENDKE